MIKKIIIIIVIFFGAITFAQSETSWIKKKNKSEKTEKLKNGDNKTSLWIKKKEGKESNQKTLEKSIEKENKKKLKLKIKESKSWITKKSKDKIKDIKEKLKNHKTLDQLPKAEYYFSATILPKADEKVEYFYGYVKSDKTSKKFRFKSKNYFSKSDGIAYFENKKNRCEIDSLTGAIGSRMGGDVVLKCKKGLKMTGGFWQRGSIGKGEGETSNGNKVIFEFFTSKTEAIAKLNSYKIQNERIQVAGDTDISEEFDINPTGKYYALLIGNSDYNDPSWTSLKSPVNDINEISNILSNKYEFEKIITLPNADRDQIFDAFDQLIELTTDRDYVLIYYAGHGETKKNQAYWVPVNGTQKIRDWVNIRDISVYVETMNAQHLVLMVDSCYTGSAFKGTNELDKNDNRDLKRFATKLLNSRARYVLSSGGNEPVIDSNGGKHSLFAKSFIRSLKESGFINMQKIAYNVAVAHSGLDQRPYFYSPETWDHAGGDFIFIPKK